MNATLDASFAAKVALRFETGSYVVKTAETKDELKAAQAMRHEVFYAEQGRLLSNRLDADEHDAEADHLLVATKSGEIIATYRLLTSTFTGRFYSDTEFTLGRFLREPDVKLELGRACVRGDHRGGPALSLLWKGLGRYASAVGARYLFGCSTVWTPDPVEANGVFRAMLDFHRDDWAIEPRAAYEHLWTDSLPRPDLVPPLLTGYLRMGARVHSGPAFDRDFQCTDFLTILDLEAMTPRRRARMFGAEAA